MFELNTLVVDDSGIMRKMVMRNLAETGLAEFSFVEAKDGQEALEKFDPEHTDAVFVDWNMPNMNGVDFVRKLRETQTKHVLVVMVTSEKTMGKIEEALDSAGADGYVVKPFTAAVLKQKLEPLFEQIVEDQKAGFFTKLATKLSE